MRRRRILDIDPVDAQETESHEVVLALYVHCNNIARFAIDYARIGNAAHKTGKRAIVGDQIFHERKDARIIVFKVDQGRSHACAFAGRILQSEIGHHIEPKLKDCKENRDEQRKDQGELKQTLTGGRSIRRVNGPQGRSSHLLRPANKPNTRRKGVRGSHKHEFKIAALYLAKEVIPVVVFRIPVR